MDNINNDHRFDVFFNDSENSNSLGFRESFDYCLNYIKTYNGSNHSYFADYKGGTVSIYDVDIEEEVYIDNVI